MIRVKYYYNENKIRGFCISGHADFAEPGYDIICSAVSVLSVNAVNSIEQFTDDRFKFNTNDGLLELHMESVSDSTQLLLDSLSLGIKGIADMYGNEYVNVLN